MGKEKISQMAAATSIVGTELIPVIQAGVNKNATPNLLLDGLFEKSSGNLKLSSVVAPSAPTVAVKAVAGNLDGNYYYSITFVTATGETEAGARSLIVAPVNQQVDLTNIPVSVDTRVTKRRIYRCIANDADAVLRKLVYELPDNATVIYTDNIADSALGVAIPWINTTGGSIYNDAMRLLAISSNSFGFGYNTMLNNTGYANTAVGTSCLTDNTTGLRNTAVGVYALYKNTTGNRNSGVGVHAINDNLTGSDNTALGYAALQHSLLANNTAVGASALQANAAGYGNSAFGSSALFTNISGQWNNAFGHMALYDNTTGYGNSAFGNSALESNTDANFNTAFGAFSQQKITAGGNVSIGANSLLNAVFAYENTVIGNNALYTSVTGHNNVALGNKAGYYETGDNKLFIDNDKRTNEADARIKALVYGIFDVLTANQLFTVNGNINALEGYKIAGAAGVSGTITNASTVTVVKGIITAIV